MRDQPAPRQRSCMRRSLRARRRVRRVAPRRRSRRTRRPSLARRQRPRRSVRDAAATALQSARRTSRPSALGLIGIRYKWGGNTPETGLDCSGLVRYVFQQVTGVTLPRTAKDMSRLGEQVALADLQPGDLVFFNTRRFAFSHVGIYLGDNRFVHAPRRGREVEVATLDSSYWQKHFNGARRLVGVLPELVPALVSEASAAAPAPLAPPESPAPNWRRPDVQP